MLGPHGEIHVQIFKPPEKFGYSMHVYQKASNGDIFYGRVDLTGNIVYKRTEPNESPFPFTLNLGEAEVHALKLALAGEPGPPASADALTDARRVRDRLLTMVEKLYMPQVLMPQTGHLLRGEHIDE